MLSANKLMSAEEAIAKYVKDGECIAFGGFSTNRRAYGLVREIIRQGRKDLCVEGGSSGGDIDMLIGAGLVEVMNVSYIANSGFSMVCRRFRDAVESGRLPVEDYSLDVQTISYHAAALGLPFVAVKNMLGSDLETVWGISEEERKKYPKLPPKKFVVIEDPFAPGSKLCAVPSPKIDVALIHVQKASPGGICRIEGASFQDEDIAIAARHTIVSCEEVVSDEEMRKDPNANTLPGNCIDAVVHMPYGAHPSQCFGYYDYDPEELKLYDKVSRTQEDFDEYVRSRVFATHDEYLDVIGRDRLEALNVDEEYGYVAGLKR